MKCDSAIAAGFAFTTGAGAHSMICFAGFFSFLLPKTNKLPRRTMLNSDIMKIIFFMSKG